MTTNKQDELSEKISRLIIENREEYGNMRYVDFKGVAKDMKILINSEVTSVLEELESKRGILSDPVHGEKSVPLSAIQTLKERYMK